MSQAVRFPTSTGPSTLRGSVFSSYLFSTHDFPFKTLRKVRQAVRWPLFSPFLSFLPHRPSYKLSSSWEGASPATPHPLFSSSVSYLCVFISLTNIYNYLICSLSFFCLHPEPPPCELWGQEQAYSLFSPVMLEQSWHFSRSSGHSAQTYHSLWNPQHQERARGTFLWIPISLCIAHKTNNHVFIYIFVSSTRTCWIGS